MNRKWQDRIQVNLDIHHGDPCIKGTRIPVFVVVGSLADGMTLEQVQEEYPQLTKEDVYAGPGIRC
jgi:uncharacterized protein (DUF433 family)